MELGEGKRALGGSQISPLFRLPPHSPGDTPGPSAPCHHPRPPSLGVPLPPIPLLTGQDPSLEPDRAAPSTMDQKIPKKKPFQAPFPQEAPACCPQAVPRCQLPLPPALPRATGMLRGGPGGAPQPSPGAEQSRNPSAPQPLPRPSLCHQHKGDFVPQSRPPPPPRRPHSRQCHPLPALLADRGGHAGQALLVALATGKREGEKGQEAEDGPQEIIWGRGLRGVRGLPPACTGDASPEGKASTPWHPLGTSVPACAPQKGTDGDIWGMEKSPPKRVLGARNPV